MLVSYHAYHIFYLPYHVNPVCNTYTDVYIHSAVAKYQKKKKKYRINLPFLSSWDLSSFVVIGQKYYLAGLQT